MERKFEMKKLLTILLLLPSMTAKVYAAAGPADPPPPAYNPPANPINPDDPFGVNDLGDAGVNLGQQDLKTTIARIINVILSFLGVLAVLIILLGGFKWMTSQGQTEKVDEAKKLIGEGVVGLVIIFAAYAIASFVLNQLYSATTVTE